MQWLTITIWFTILMFVNETHGITVSEDIKEEVTNMCIYTANVIEKSEARGEARGISKGEKKLAEAIREYRDNVQYNELVDKYGETTAKLAVELA